MRKTTCFSDKISSKNTLLLLLSQKNPKRCFNSTCNMKSASTALQEKKNVNSVKSNQIFFSSTSLLSNNYKVEKTNRENMLTLFFNVDFFFFIFYVLERSVVVFRAAGTVRMPFRVFSVESRDPAQK